VSIKNRLEELERVISHLPAAAPLDFSILSANEVAILDEANALRREKGSKAATLAAMSDEQLEAMRLILMKVTPLPAPIGIHGGPAGGKCACSACERYRVWHAAHPSQAVS
jgi:hypothetical protein